MDDCFQPSHRTAPACQSSTRAPLRAGPSNARIARFDGPLQMEAHFGIALACIWNGCIRCSSRGPAGRLDTLQSPPCRMRHRGDAMTTGKRHHRGRLRERLILPTPTSVDHTSKRTASRARGVGGLYGQTRGCPSVTGLIGSPRFSPDDKKQLPGGVLWYQASAQLPRPFVERRQASSPSRMWLFLPITNSMYGARISTCRDTNGLDPKSRAFSRPAGKRPTCGREVMIRSWVMSYTWRQHTEVAIETR